MERSEVIAKLKRNEAELKRLGVEHLYLFGSTARGEAREDSDVDLFFDHPEGSRGLFALMDVKEAAARIRWAQNRHHDPAQLAPGSARGDRGLGAADILMAAPSSIARLTDIIDRRRAGWPSRRRLRETQAQLGEAPGGDAPYRPHLREEQLGLSLRLTDH